MAFGDRQPNGRQSSTNIAASGIADSKKGLTRSWQDMLALDMLKHYS